ncbi:tryptophan--tRNA ligase, partial [Candidatus Bathyarchaeota archaeon]
GKMSASEPETSIFTKDSPEVVKRKIWNAFTGGRATVKEQKKLGGDPNVCTIFQYFAYLFEEDDKKLAERERKCRAGEILCGECKSELTERVNKFLAEHQRKRERARDIVENFHIKR